VRPEALPEVLKRLRSLYPKAPVALMEKVHRREPFKLLVCALLSTRTKDELTHRVCERLFKQAGTPEELARLPVEEIERLIYPVGFYRVKARQLKKLAETLSERYGGKVPLKEEELLKLPGVGRKVAGVVLGSLGRRAVGVDTHVQRIVNRWGLLETRTPLETERELLRLLPDELVPEFNRLVVALGQTVCKPRRPDCGACPVEPFCKKRFTL